MCVGSLPVAIRSSTTITVWPGLIASACISNESCIIYSPVRRVFVFRRISTAYHAVLLLVAGGDRLSGEFARLPHRNECRSQPQRNDRPEQKSASIEANDNVDLFGRRAFQRVRGNVVHQMGDQSLKDEGIP